MLTSQIKDDRPVITITVGSLLEVQNVLALVDTGFTAELKISSEIAEELGIKTEYTERVSLAAGDPIVIGAGFAFVSMEGVTHKVSVLIGGRPSIGVSLLRKFGYTLNMDFPNNVFHLKKEMDLFDTAE